MGTGGAARDDLSDHLAAVVTVVPLTVAPATIVLPGSGTEAGPVAAAVRRRGARSPLRSEPGLAARLAVPSPDRSPGALGAPRLAAEALVPCAGPVAGMASVP